MLLNTGITAHGLVLAKVKKNTGTGSLQGSSVLLDAKGTVSLSRQPDSKSARTLNPKIWNSLVFFVVDLTS